MPRRCHGRVCTAPKRTQGRATADEVAGRAFELYERRCSIDGWDIDDALEPDSEPIQSRTSLTP